MQKQNDKEKTRRVIVKSASIQFRRDGLDAVGVRPLMAEAGLTHGGFYAYFSSKAELAAAAIESALDETRNALALVAANAPAEEKLQALIDAYLSHAHRRLRDKGCAAAALAEEIARQPAGVRDAFTRAIMRTVDLFVAALPPGGTAEERRTRGCAVFSLLVGALQLSRSATDTRVSDRLILGGRREALALSASPWPKHDDG